MANKKGNPDILKHGFAAHPENIHRGGRPKKIFTILKDQGYSKDDIQTAFGQLAWYTLEELKVMAAKTKGQPAIVSIVANQFIKAHANADWNRIKEILEHTIGRPKQDIGISETVIKGITLD